MQAWEQGSWPDNKDPVGYLFDAIGNPNAV
jgi:hypothetical protein